MTKTTAADSDMIRQAILAGDPDLIELLVSRYYEAIYRLALSILEDAAEAEDAAQEVFLAAARKLDSYRGDAAPKTWLFAIGVNVCRMQLRHRARQQRVRRAWAVLRGHTTPVAPLLEEIAAQAEESGWLVHAVRELDEKHRLPILLRYVHDMTAAEIAGILGIPEGTVYSRLHYAHRRLREQLGRNAGNEDE